MTKKPAFIHHEEVRKKIKCTQLINRLNAHINADKPLLDASQVSAAKALLNKVLPDLKSMEVMGQGGGGIIVQIIKDGNGNTTE